MASLATATRLPAVFGLALDQSEVDFVVPDLANDLPLCIDPFLLFKSKDPRLRELQKELLAIFAQGFQLHREGQRRDLDRLIDFPEVNEIGFGYTRQGIHGSGLGFHLNALLAETLASSEELQQRGLRHIEELQLVSIGVSADRVSDIAASVLKSYLIDYTREQAALWNIPIERSVPVNHYFDAADMEWADGYFDLPRNPISGLPILLVPRRIVRQLPWINYDDFLRHEVRLFLNPRGATRAPRYPGMAKERRLELAKKEVVTLTREHIVVLDRYVERKEQEGADALPALGPSQPSINAERKVVEDFRACLSQIPTGTKASGDYQRLVFEIVNFLFEPELTDGRMEEQTYLKTERRDIIYTNESDRSFWQYIRQTYASTLVMFEVKNVSELERGHINQVAGYLGARLGMFGVIATREPAPMNIVRKTYVIYNDTPSMPRKIILVLSDADLLAMMQQKLAGADPTKHVQRIYRDFMTSVQ
jgi:hypothetical protein